jgi:hypothetical protein
LFFFSSISKIQLDVPYDCKLFQLLPTASSYYVIPEIR